MKMGKCGIVASGTLAVVIGALILYYGNIQFGGYDGSILINHAWQLYLGYPPYVEVVTGWPPLLLIGSNLAFAIWGINWNALVVMAAIFAVFTFLLQALILQELGLGLFYSLLLSFTIQAVTMVVIGWWWYNHITAVVSCLFVSSALLFYRTPRRLSSSMVLLFTTVALALSKINVAGILVSAVFALMFFIPRLRFRILIVVAGAACLTMGVLLFAHINPVDVIASYRMFAGSALSLRRVVDFLLLNNKQEVLETFLACIPGVLAMILLLLRPNAFSRLKQDQIFQLILAFLSIGAGILAMSTNNELNMSDTPLMLLGMILIIQILCPNLASPKLRTSVSSLFLITLVLLMVNGLRYSALRYRVQSVGPGAFYEEAPLIRLQTPPLFQGMFVGPRFVRVLSQMEQVLQTAGYLGNANAPVFFGPRIDFGYAAYGIHPYPGLPTWWEFFSQDDQAMTMINRFENANFKMMILLNSGNGGDMTYFPPSLIAYINNNYEARDMGELVVYQLREATAP